MKYRICKAKTEQRLSATVNELLLLGGQIVGRSYQAEEELKTGGVGRPKTIKLFYQTMMLPDEVTENVNLGNPEDIEAWSYSDETKV